MAHFARPELGERSRSCAYVRYVNFFQSSEVAFRIERILHSALDIL